MARLTRWYPNGSKPPRAWFQAKVRAVTVRWRPRKVASPGQIGTSVSLCTICGMSSNTNGLASPFA